MRALIITVCVLAITGTLRTDVSAVDIPQMNCNLTTDFAMELLECMVRPFEDLIDLIPFSEYYTKIADRESDYHPHSKYLGRMNEQQWKIMHELKESKTVADVFRVVHGMEERQFEKLLVKMTPPDKREKKNAATRRMLMEHVVKEIVNNVDFDQVIDEGLLRVLGTAGALRAKLMEVVADKQIDLPIDWDTIVNLICLVEPHLCKMAKCLPNYSETEFEDDISFIQCFYICQDLPIVSSCMRDAFAGCKVGVLNKVLSIELDWMSDLIMRLFVDFLQLNDCMLMTTPNKGYVIKEGGGNAELTIQSMVPPGVHCFRKMNFLNTPLGAAELLVQFLMGGLGDCDVEIQLSTSNYIRDLMTQRTPETTISVPIIGKVTLGSQTLQYPICRSGRSIPQYVIGWHEYANESAGIIKLTNENWNETFSIPIEATIDNKVEIHPALKFFQQDFLTLKVKTGMFTKFSSKIDLVRMDRDVYKFRSCWMVNGPHLRTFDGHYYNNFYEGHFVLYRHKTLPYEVQVVTQACPNVANSTCTCAASVRSANDVFSVDWCRRYNQSQEEVVMKVALYLIGDLTNGTRIYRHDEGLTYKVLLPHGTLVTITATMGRLSIWVRPSAYDRGTSGLISTRQIEGLCGDFDGSARKDLRTRDGKVYKGPGAGVGEQPQGFSKDWRIVDKNDVILWGVNGTKTDLPVTKRYCACSHILMMGSQCTCGYDVLVSDCDINSDGKLPHLFPLISKYSLPRFYTDQPDQEKEDLIDFSDDYMTADPKVYNWTTDNDTCDFCKELIEEDPVQFECERLIEKMTNFTVPWMPQLDIYQKVCQRDAQLSEEDDWSLSSKMAARQHCHDMLDLTSLYSAKDLQPLYNMDCPNDCNPGIANVTYCLNGTCVCDEHHMGPDCSLLKDKEPVMLMPKFSHCDTRHQNCSYATVYGKNFVKDKVFCHHAQSEDIIHPHILTINQIACKLPSNATSNRVTISLTSEKPQTSVKVDLASTSLDSNMDAAPSDTESFDFVAFDSLCFSMDVDGRPQERQETDHCLVEKTCYQPEEASADDECYVCYPEVSISNLEYSTSAPCLQRKKDEAERETARRNEWKLRIIVTSVLCGLVIIITIIVFIVSRPRRKNAATEAHDKPVMNCDVPDLAASNAVYEMSDSVPHGDAVAHSDILGDGGIDNPATNITSSMSTLTATSPTSVLNGDLSESPRNASQLPAANEINAREMAEFWHIKHMAAQRSRMRSDSQGSRASSIASKGIGGSGASHFSTRSSTGGSIGIGGAGPAHFGRLVKRAYTGPRDDADTVDNIGLGAGGAVCGACVRL